MLTAKQKKDWVKPGDWGWCNWCGSHWSWVAGWAPVQVKREANAHLGSLRLQGSCQGNSVKRTLNNPTCGESPDPWWGPWWRSTEEVPEAMGVALRRPRPLLSTRRADVSFVVSVSRAGTAFRRNGEGGAGGGKSLFQLQSWLGNVARNANRGSFCNKEGFHRY